MISPRRIVSGMKEQYDKLIALVLLLGLIASLVYLALEIGRITSRQQQFVDEIARMRPKHPTAAPVDLSVYEWATKRLEQAFLLPSWSNALFVPEARVWCVDCRRPIPFKATKCPFCGAAQPFDAGDNPKRDLDRDGMLDVWEEQHGLNPADPRDAQLDSDGDGFSNLEEFLANTDPKDPASHPPIESKLHVVRLVPDPFKLRFKAVTTLPGGKLRFQLNLKGDVRTYFADIGDTVEGFTLEKYEPAAEERDANGTHKKADVLTLRRGNKHIALIRGEEIQYNEYTAELNFSIDGRNFRLKIGDEFTLVGDTRYKLIEIDTARQRVVIERLHDGAKLDIWKLPEGTTRDDRSRE